MTEISMNGDPIRRRRHGRLLAVLGSGLLLALIPSRTFAGYTTCDLDPTVTLSNGRVITLWAHVGYSVTRVAGVNYTLHVPQGTSVRSISYDQYGYLEHLAIVADIKSGSYNYESDTTVLTTTSGLTVTAWSSMANGNNTYSVSGVSGQTLVIRWG